MYDLCVLHCSLSKNMSHPSSLSPDFSEPQKKKRGRPLGSRNTVKHTSAVSTATPNISSSTKRTRRVKNTSAKKSSASINVKIPSVKELEYLDADENDIRDDGMDVDESSLSGEDEQRQQNDFSEETKKRSKKIIEHMYENLYCQIPNEDGSFSPSTQSIHKNEEDDEIERHFTYHSSSFVVGEDVWPSQTDKPCWNCLRRFNHTPTRNAKNFDASNIVFSDIYGIWCSPQCLRTYLEERNEINIGHKFLIVNAIAKYVLKMTMEESAGKAPPSKCHVNLGGTMSDDEYHSASSRFSRIVQIDQSMLMPSPLIFEVTQKKRVDECRQQQDDDSMTISKEGGLYSDHIAPTLTYIGVDMDENGNLISVEPEPRTVRARIESQCELVGVEKPVQRFKAGGYAFNTIYTRI